MHLGTRSWHEWLLLFIPILQTQTLQVYPTACKRTRTMPFCKHQQKISPCNHKSVAKVPAIPPSSLFVKPLSVHPQIHTIWGHISKYLTASYSRQAYFQLLSHSTHWNRLPSATPHQPFAMLWSLQVSAMAHDSSAMTQPWRLVFTVPFGYLSDALLYDLVTELKQRGIPRRKQSQSYQVFQRYPNDETWSETGQICFLLKTSL